jgi:hypothetical protein
MDPVVEQTDEPVAETPHFVPSLVWGAFALTTPVVASALGILVDYGGQDGRYSMGYIVVAAAMGLACATGFYNAWRTQKEAAQIPWKRRLSYFAGFLSAMMLLFWFVGTLAVSRLGPYWR